METKDTMHQGCSMHFSTARFTYHTKKQAKRFHTDPTLMLCSSSFLFFYTVSPDMEAMRPHFCQNLDEGKAMPLEQGNVMKLDETV